MKRTAAKPQSSSSINATERQTLELSLFGLSRKLLWANAALASNIRALSKINCGTHVIVGGLIQAASVLNCCVSEMVAISRLPQSPLPEITSEILRDYELLHVSPLPTGFLETDVRTRENGLSNREREIVRLLAEGKNNKHVADALGISIRTVETHRAKIMLKLGLHSIGELVSYAFRNKIVDP